jgi:hypothetical protein
MFGESARISGLGISNSIAKSRDPHALMANPAGLAGLEDTEVVSTYEDRDSGTIRDGATCLTLKNIGLKIRYMTIPEIEKRDESGALLGNMDYSEDQLAAAYGFKLSPLLAVGVGLKIFTRSLDRRNSLGSAANVGAIYQASDNVSFGGVVENIGGQSSLNKEGPTHSTPMTTRLGYRASVASNLYILGGMAFSRENDPVWSFGAEYLAFNIITLRAGYDTGGESYDALSGGIGLNLSKSLKLDYSVNSHPVLGNTHALSVTFAFPKKPAETAQAK